MNKPHRGPAALAAVSSCENRSVNTSAPGSRKGTGRCSLWEIGIRLPNNYIRATRVVSHACDPAGDLRQVSCLKKQRWW